MIKTLNVFKAAALCAALAVVSVDAAPVSTSKTEYQLQIPVASLAHSLAKFGAQTGYQVVYAPDLVAGIQAPAVNGKLSADSALDALLKDSGLIWTRVNDNTVALKRVGEKASGLNPGDQMRVVQTDSEAASRTEEKARKADSGPEVVVKDRRIKPFTDANVDLPRTIDDEQPYYIFDAKTIEQSGATNIEEFLRNRLTMNTVTATGSQVAAATSRSVRNAGTTSAFNLRGLGTDRTLVLVNGRPLAGVVSQETFNYKMGQPDVNGIPLASIDRIEVLPSSAGALYGANAVGGVINIILRKNYSGLELRANYGATWEGAAPRKSFSGTYGLLLEEGRTQLSLAGSYSESEPNYFSSNLDLYHRGLGLVSRNSPGYLTTPGTPPPGSLPNISAFIGFYTDPFGPEGPEAPPTEYRPTTLTLKNGGAALNSLITHIPSGTSASTDAATLTAGLLANAGRYDLTPPATNQSPIGTRLPLGSYPRTESVSFSLNRRMTDSVELFATVSHALNHSYSSYNPFESSFILSPSNPYNPFNELVRITVPFNADNVAITESISQSATLGSVISLPLEWRATVDFTASRSKFSSYADVGVSGYTTSQSTMNWLLAMQFGLINPFLDTVANPFDLSAFGQPLQLHTKGESRALTVRAAGPLLRLPWGSPTVAVSYVLGRSGSPGTTFDDAGASLGGPAMPVRVILFDSTQRSENLGAELSVPLITDRNSLALLRGLSLQTAMAVNSTRTSTGTFGMRIDAVTGELLNYFGPTVDGTPTGDPYRGSARYESNNKTLGLSYTPFRDVTLRMSYATSFLPPTYDQLSPNLLADPFPSAIHDPRNPNPPVIDYNDGVFNYYGVRTQSGGNPLLTPQSSDSVNVGLIFQPSTAALSGLRMNLEYYKIDQRDGIQTPSAQFIIDNESLFPGRVTRDANDLITEVDISLLNLFRFTTSGWDMSISYQAHTEWGLFQAALMGTRILEEKRQVGVQGPALDYAGWVNSGGPIRTKANAALNWSRSGLSLGWNTRFYPSYRQSGQPGDPFVFSTFTGTYFENDAIIRAQGAREISPQLYHDLFVGYDFGTERSGWQGGVLSRASVALNIGNVFNRAPAFDAYNRQTFSSYLGPIDGRTFSVTVKKSL